MYLVVGENEGHRMWGPRDEKGYGGWEPFLVEGEGHTGWEPHFVEGQGLGQRQWGTNL